MVTAMAAKEFGIAPGFLCGLLVGCILGGINGSLVGWFRIPAFIATAGMFTYARALAWWLGGGLPVEFLPSGFEFLGNGRVFGIPMPVVTVAILLIPVHLLLTRTTLGRYLYSIGGNKEAARLSGVRTAPYKLLAFVISGLFGAIAGIVLSSRIVAGHPGIAVGLEFQAIAAIAIGGVSLGGGEGNVFRAIIGAIIIGVIANGMNLANISTYFQQMAFGLIVVVSTVIDVAQRRRAQIGQKKS
jgi:ribose/xylose/arabinose/galactoside ABC-type transport system permease subunit